MPQAPLWLLPEDLADICRDDPETGSSILETFVEQIRLSLGRIRARVDAGEPKELGRELHRLKGSLLQLGASSTGARCKEFELVAASEPASMWRTRLDVVESECAQVLDQVQAFLATPPTASPS